jgi:hypothetical protein
MLKGKPAASGRTGFNQVLNSECGSLFNSGDNRILRTLYQEDPMSLSVTSLSFNPVTWECSQCPKKHKLVEQGGEGGGSGPVIVLTDQNFSGVLPNISGKCLSIVRLEQGKIDELGDLLLKILPKGGLPRGTIVVVGSLSHLQKENVSGYATACVKIVKRFDGFFKKDVRTVPFVPPPMGGCDNPRMAKDISDLCGWLENMDEYPLKSAMNFLSKMVNITVSEGGVRGTLPPPIVSFPHENIYLPFSFEDYKGLFVQSPGRPDYLASLPVWSMDSEKRFVVSLIQDLNSQLMQDLDTDPNFSRSKTRPAMHAALRTWSVDAAVIIGGSNAEQLADCCTALGLDVVKHVKSGWKINKDSVDKLLPDLVKTLSQTRRMYCTGYNSGVRQLLLLWRHRRQRAGSTQPVRSQGQRFPRSRRSRRGSGEVDHVDCHAAKQNNFCVWRQTDIHPLNDAEVHHHAML